MVYVSKQLENIVKKIAFFFKKNNAYLVDREPKTLKISSLKLESFFWNDGGYLIDLKVKSMMLFNLPSVIRMISVAEYPIGARKNNSSRLLI